MSLDVHLTSGPDRIEPCPHCDGKGFWDRGPEEVFWANITHNLNEMADAAGIYEACWRPETIGITKAGQLIPLLTAGLERLRADPAKYEQYNAPNGWGLYKHFVPWVEKYLRACEEYPEADVRVSR